MGLWAFFFTMNYLNQSPDERLETYQNQIKNQTALTNSNEDTSIIYQPVKIEDQKIAAYQNYNGNTAFTSSIMNSPIVTKPEQKQTVIPELNEENTNEAETYINRIGRDYNESRLKLAQANAATPTTTPTESTTDYNTDIGNRLFGDKLFERFRLQLSANESSHNYGEVNPNAESGAWGRYQFIWGKRPGKGQRDLIKKVTGITTPEEFLKNSGAQEKYFKYYYDNTLTPELKKFRKEFPQIKWSDTQTLEALHFRGYDGLRRKINKGELNTSDKINPSVMSRVNKVVGEKTLNAKAFTKIDATKLAEMKTRFAARNFN